MSGRLHWVSVSWIVCDSDLEKLNENIYRKITTDGTEILLRPEIRYRKRIWYSNR